MTVRAGGSPDGVVRVAVVSDTHRQGGGDPARGRPLLPDTALERIAGADALLHAGDILDQATLDALAALAPLWAVLGNNDPTLVGILPVSLVVELGGVRIGMIHDSGTRAGRAARLRRRFPTEDVVVYGHSHIPADEEGVDGQLLINPGSPTQRRAQPRHTMAELELAGGRVLAHRIVALD